MAKTVITYSWLARKAMALHRKDPAEYQKLLDAGSDKILTGANLRWYGHQFACNWFEIRVGGQRWCTIHGAEVGGKFYTHYDPCFTVTQYRKRLVDKYMPFTLPEGVRSHYNNKGGTTPCWFHNVDGSVAWTGNWIGGRRRRTGHPSRLITVCDTTGEFVVDENLSSVVSGNNQQASLMQLGWFDQASRNRKEWLASVASMTHCDTEKVLKVAAQAYLAASRLCERFPKMRMALFPAVLGVPPRRHGGFPPEGIILYRQDDVVEQWGLPEVLVYWLDNTQYLALSLTIPPHGCPLLDPTGRAGLLSKTYMSRSVNHNHWRRDPWPESATSACHQLRAYRPDTPEDEKEYWPGPRGSYYSYGKGSEDEHSHEKHLVFWPDHRDKVAVRIDAVHPTGEEVNLPMPMHSVVAMKPESVLLMFEEKMLIESLPLC